MLTTSSGLETHGLPSQNSVLRLRKQHPMLPAALLAAMTIAIMATLASAPVQSLELRSVVQLSCSLQLAWFTCAADEVALIRRIERALQLGPQPRPPLFMVVRQSSKHSTIVPVVLVHLRLGRNHSLVLWLLGLVKVLLSVHNLRAVPTATMARERWCRLTVAP